MFKKFKRKINNLANILKYSDSEFVELLWPFAMFVAIGSWTVQRILGVMPESFPYQVLIDPVALILVLIHFNYMVSTPSYALQTIQSIKKRCTVSSYILTWLISTMIMIAHGGVIGVEVTKVLSLIVYSWITWRLRFELYKRRDK